MYIDLRMGENIHAPHLLLFQVLLALARFLCIIPHTLSWALKKLFQIHTKKFKQFSCSAVLTQSSTQLCSSDPPTMLGERNNIVLINQHGIWISI